MTWKVDPSEAPGVMHQLKVIHRSWRRASVGASNRAEMQASARVVRRWMRKLRRMMRRQGIL